MTTLAFGRIENPNFVQLFSFVLALMLIPFTTLVSSLIKASSHRYLSTASLIAALVTVNHTHKLKKMWHKDQCRAILKLFIGDSLSLPFRFLIFSHHVLEHY